VQAPWSPKGCCFGDTILDTPLSTVRDQPRTCLTNPPDFEHRMEDATAIPCFLRPDWSEFGVSSSGRPGMQRAWTTQLAAFHGDSLGAEVNPLDGLLLWRRIKRHREFNQRQCGCASFGKGGFQWSMIVPSRWGLGNRREQWHPPAWPDPNPGSPHRGLAAASHCLARKESIHGPRLCTRKASKRLGRTTREMQLTIMENDYLDYLSETLRVGAIRPTGNHDRYVACVSKRENQAFTHVNPEARSWYRWLVSNAVISTDCQEKVSPSFGPIPIGQLSFPAINTVTDAAASLSVAPQRKRNEQTDCMNQPCAIRRRLQLPFSTCSSIAKTYGLGLPDGQRPNQSEHQKFQRTALSAHGTENGRCNGLIIIS
jgi:hypothetical protein